MAIIQALVASFGDSRLPFAAPVLIPLLAVGLILLATYVITSLQFYVGSLRNRTSSLRQPLTVPYCIPYLGSALSMIDQHGLYKSLMSKEASKQPLRLKLGSQSIYLMLRPENVRQVYQHSRELSMARKIKEFLHCNLIPSADFAIFDSDRSGDLVRPSHDIAPEKRVFFNTIKVFEKDLTAQTASNDVAAKFQETLLDQLHAFSDTEFFSVGLFKFLQREMLIPSGLALNGEELFRQNPQWHKTYWEYEKNFLLLSLNLPRWLCPGVYKARDEFMASIYKWYNSSYAKDNFNDASIDKLTWEPNWGSRFWRRLMINFHGAGMSMEGAAAPCAGILWALHSNAIPATAWILFEILSSHLLFREVMEELSTVLTSSSPPTFNVKALLTLPILNSVYEEVLRLRVSLIIYREAIKDISINGTMIPEGATILTPSWPAHTSEHVWAPVPASRDANTGKESLDAMTLPADKFDPYRFLAMHNIKTHPRATKAQRERVAAALSHQNYFPWGGGSHMCAGRNFAKQEIFITLATILVGFDIEILGWEKHEKGWPEARTGADAQVLGQKPERPAGPDLSYAGAAVLPPDRDLRVSMRRRNW